MDLREGQRAYKEGRFADAARHLAVAALANPADASLSLMLARTCARLDWPDLAWIYFDRVAASSGDDGLRNLANQGKAGLPQPAPTPEIRLIASGALPAPWLARARSEVRDGESALSWMIRQDAITFDRVVESLLPDMPPPPSRPARERLGMLLLHERRISQGDLKKALAAQAEGHRPLGAILVERFGLPPAALEAALRAQASLKPRLGPNDSPPALLIRWGALRREDWEAAKGHGARAFEILVAMDKLLAANVRRADAYLKVKQQLLREGRFRLGEQLITQGVIDRETLGKALAWQVDQPYRLGELLIRHRLASAERVLEALQAQLRRYDAEAESLIPPLEHPAPPPPVVEPPPRPESRRKWVLAGLAVLSLALALFFANRYTRGDFAWLEAFVLPPKAPETHERGAAELLGGIQASGPRRERATGFDPLDLPASELSGQRMSASRAEGMIGAPTAQGFVGTPTEGQLDGMPAIDGQKARPYEAGQLVGTAIGQQPVGSSGVTDSQAYQVQGGAGTQAPIASRQGATSRQSEMLALERLQYPVQAERHLAEGPAAPELGRMQERQEGQGRLQEAIGLGQLSGGAPPEGIQVRRDTAVFRLRLGRSLYDRRDVASAREEFLSAIRLDPTLSPPHYYLGRIAEDAGDRELAAKWYASYLERATAGEHTDEARARLRQLKD